MPGIRQRIIIARRYPVYIRTRDTIKNICEHAMHAHGYRRQDQMPTRWGFGVRARRVGPQHFYQVEEIILGSADPEIAETIAAVTAEDLCEPNAVPGAGLVIKEANIVPDTPWLPTPAAQFLTVSPIRVLAGHHQTILTPGAEWEAAINRTMTARFGWPFALRVQPDSLYVRRRKGEIVARMAIKVGPEGQVRVYPGIVMPIVLSGPPTDIATAWYSGLGGSTGMGFGCLDLLPL